MLVSTEHTTEFSNNPVAMTMQWTPSCHTICQNAGTTLPLGPKIKDTKPYETDLERLKDQASTRDIGTYCICKHVLKP